MLSNSSLVALDYHKKLTLKGAQPLDYNQGNFVNKSTAGLICA